MPMQHDGTPAEVGSFRVEVYGAGRRGRQTVSRFTLRCDAVALHDREVLLLSVAGPETAVKALAAGLRSSRADQGRLAYTAEVGDLTADGLRRYPDGYRVARTRLAYGLWHILFLARRDGFLPALSEEALWRHLRSEHFTTPLRHDWVPWLLQEMTRRELLIQPIGSGCCTGLVLADDVTLDALVVDGVRQGRLVVGGRTTRRFRTDGAEDLEVGDLDQYLLAHGSLLGRQAERALEPLHVPGRDPLSDLGLLRQLFDAQAHVVEAIRKALCRQKALLLVGEMGTGKTLMALAGVHAHAGGRPYRALVFCPGQLVGKWGREVCETIPGARVVRIASWKDLLHLDRATKPDHPEWYIIARDRAKLGAAWQPACRRPGRLDDGYLRCPDCGGRLVNAEREPLVLGTPARDGRQATGLWKRRSRCEWVLADSRGQDPAPEDVSGLRAGCGSPLWQMTGRVRRYEPALYIKRHLRRFFSYLVLDEVHEEKGQDTAQGHAAAALAAACRKVLALTGTLIGGYAEHLRPLLFRLAPRSLVKEGLGWTDATAFNERYGRIETRITERSTAPGEDNRTSRGSRSTVKSVRPGVLPTLFGRHLVDKAVFLSLAEVADGLPPLTESCVPVRMDAELARAYRTDLEGPLAEAIKDMLRRGDRRLLGAMLQALLAYPDRPFGWESVGYGRDGEFVTVATPPDLPEDVVRPKERALIDLVLSERERGRQVWVYVQYTDRRDVQCRLERLLAEAGLRAGVLRSDVPPERREDWIGRHGPGLDVVVSHPRLVETGLDLFDLGGRYNFPTLCFYQTGYNLFTLRQASRRSWRIGQQEPCRVVYLSYEGTMQERALALLGKKLTAAQALEGRFSAEGLAALAGEDADVEVALAHSLAGQIDEGDVRRHWGRAAPVDRPGSLPVPEPAGATWLWKDLLDAIPERAPACLPGRRRLMLPAPVRRPPRRVAQLLF